MHQAWCQAFRVENGLPTLPATLSSLSPPLSLPATILQGRASTPPLSRPPSIFSAWQPRAIVLVGEVGHTAPCPSEDSRSLDQSSLSPFHHSF